MDRRSKAVLSLCIVLALVLLVPAGALGKGTPGGGGGGGGGGPKPPPTESTNNLSFPVIATDGFVITPVAYKFSLPYTGLYPGVAEAKEYGPTYIAYLEANKPWFAQKTENKWQADFTLAAHANVTYVDWSDSMEGVFPKAGNPFRLEVVLFNDLLAVDPDTNLAGETMTKYVMGVLEYPSSPNELQGTKDINNTLESNYATIISSQPKLVVQYLGAEVPALTWDPVLSKWVRDDNSIPPADRVSFAVELNVGGKYIFGASKKGWVPANNGFYRVTFYAPVGSQVDMTGAITADSATGFLPSAGDAATGYITPDNLAYIDLEVGGVADPGGDE